MVPMETERIRSAPYWTMTNADTLDLLEVKEKVGLSEADVAPRQELFGTNRIESVQKHTKLRLFFRQFKSPLIVVLVLAAFLTLAIGHWFDGIILTLAVLINTGLGFYQENKAENAIAHLRSFITVRTRVIRDGREMEIDAANLVVGDIIHLTLGVRVPADARLLSAQGLRVDESILTGESLPVAKHAQPLSEDVLLQDRLNCVVGGTLVTEGGALAVVTAVGMATEFGKIAGLVDSTEREETPLARSLSSLAWNITIIVVVLVLLVFVLGVNRGEPIFDMFLIAIAIAIAAIPEALPIALTAVLAIGVEQLAKRQGIMRSLTAAETLGSTSVVMTDKTGTLTKAELTLTSIQTTNDLLTGDVDTQQALPNKLSAEHRDLLTIASLATDVVVENPDEDPASWRIVGSPLESSIVQVAAQHGIEFRPRDERGIVAVVPFSSSHKFSVHATAVSVSSDLLQRKEGYAHIILGAPDVLLQRSALSKDDFLALQERINAESRAGKRLVGVAVAYIDSARQTHTQYRPDDITDVTFVGTLAFFDPVRDEVPKAVQRIEQHGVRVVMATGDLLGTAVAVAQSLGWEVKESETLTGEAMAHMDDSELRDALAYTRVFARVTPRDKLRVAKLFQSNGEVVAMTGDGVNDAPSLKAVDIGIAVGSGSDVAKSVADLILLDDNFNTIVSAIEIGKRVLRNIRKAFVYLVSNSLDEIFLIGGSMLLALPLPLSAMQIIWINFFTSSLPAIAFAFDDDISPEGSTEKVRDRRILNGMVVSMTIILAVFSAVALFAMYVFLSQTSIDTEIARTFVFTCFASYILFVAYALRDLDRSIFEYNPFSNRFLNFAVAGGLVLLVGTVYMPGAGAIFSTVPLPLPWLFGVVVWVIVNVGLAEVVKFVHRRWHR